MVGPSSGIAGNLFYSYLYMLGTTTKLQVLGLWLLVHLKENLI